ncbi:MULTISPECIES: hypothetical protein [unclassified Bradyrhizobium]|jgi:hypothetical protein|uniref:hypothetical protein n=1 Tax=unclassified Bradyrhizobium TaxID=2631580 RepID=UPI00036D8938|nr:MULTISPECIES: hypothetical protein [unclassified Bradyrhizobium]MCK1432518.1 hypothetical protein [Bradyrhizobium sp. 87]MCK1661877.1 hypothetical protein [Bradyrhizobium sp. 151]
MIIFPFGFYVLEGKLPVYLGNDLEAQKAMQAWLEANPDCVQLRLDVIGPEQLLTRFLGFDVSGRSAAMDHGPLLFETTCCEKENITVRRLYHDYDAALRGHAELIEISRKRLH